MNTFLNASIIFENVYFSLLYRNVRCGSLQCRNGNPKPVANAENDLFSTTIIYNKGEQIECK